MIRSSSFSNLSSQPPTKQPFSFGGASSTQTQQPASAGTFSFGNTVNNNSSTGATGRANANTSSLFGTKPATTAPFAGFSFGQSFSQQPSTQAPSTSSGGLFGAPDALQPTTANNTSSLFGQTPSQYQQQQQQQQQQPAASGGIFEGSGGASGFGASTSLFGRSQPAASTSTNTFGLIKQQQTQQQNQTQNLQSPFYRHAYYQKERFNDLPDEARNLVEEMDKIIQSQVSIRDEIQPKLIPSSNSTTALASLGSQVHQLYSSLHSASLSLSSLKASIDYELSHVRKLASGVESDRQDFAVLWEVGANYRNSVTMAMGGNGSTPAPGTAGTHSLSASTSTSASASQPLSSHSGEKYREFLRNYFFRAAQDFSSRIVLYRDTLGSISRHLSSLSSRDAHSPQAISDTIYFQHSHFMNLASQVATLNSDVETLKRDYRSWYARQFRSAQDPFERMAQDVGSSL